MINTFLYLRPYKLKHLNINWNILNNNKSILRIESKIIKWLRQTTTNTHKQVLQNIVNIYS